MDRDNAYFQDVVCHLTWGRYTFEKHFVTSQVELGEFVCELYAYFAFERDGCINNIITLMEVPTKRIIQSTEDLRQLIAAGDFYLEVFCTPGSANDPHARIICNACDKAVLGPIRYKCGMCTVSYDLCMACEERQAVAPFHDTNHLFVKIRKAVDPYGEAPFNIPCPYAPDAVESGLYSDEDEEEEEDVEEEEEEEDEEEDEEEEEEEEEQEGFGCSDSYIAPITDSEFDARLDNLCKATKSLLEQVHQLKA